MGKKIYRGDGWEFIPADGDKRPEEVVSLPPGEQEIKVALSKRAKGKIVTLAEGFRLAAADLKGLAKSLKQTCASGGAVREMAIEIQGDHVTVIKDALREMGFRVQ